MPKTLQDQLRRILWLDGKFLFIEFMTEHIITLIHLQYLDSKTT